MNCKPGELAVIVKSMAGNEGKIVRCLRLATKDEVLQTRFTIYPVVWLIDKALPTRLGHLAPLAYDVGLRPIRDPGPDAVDETLTWKPVPFPQVEAA